MTTVDGREVEGRQPTKRVTAEDILRSSSGFEHIENAGGIGFLLVQSLRYAIVPPFTWWRAAVTDGSLMIRRCLIPLIMAVATFVIGFGFFVLGGITKTIGATDREGGAVIIGFLREASIWITGMIFAGVAGSAMAADLGARKIREELDALAVLGVNQVKTLVVPKVMAAIVVSPILGLLCVLIIQVVNVGLAPSQFGFPTNVLLASTQGSLITYDIYGALIRYVIIGAFVGAVGCYKGLTCKGGTEGVGRAVNETIVICFFGVWMLDAFFNLAYLSLFPAAQASFKG